MTPFKDNDREDKTSASGFADDFACLGRRNFINSLPPLPEPKQDDSTDYGNAVHDALEDSDKVLKLDDEQLDTYNAILAQEEALVSQWRGEHNIGNFVSNEFFGREERFWVTDEAFTKLTSAKLDRFWVEQNAALIIDVKSLYAPRLPRAYDSWQLRIQAVALWQEYDCGNIRVAYNCPNRFGRKVDVADFTLADLKRFEAEIKQIVALMGRPDAPRTPGDQCRYCPGKTFCPEAMAMSLLPSVVAQTQLGIDKAGVYEKVDQLSVPDLVFLWQRRSLTSNINEAVNDRMKTLPEDVLAEYGIKVVDGKDTSKVLGPQIKAMCAALVAAGLSEEKVWECLSLNTGSLNELAAMQRGGTKKDAMAWAKDQVLPFKTPDRGDKMLKEGK